MQAYLVSQAVNHGWRRALPIAFAPLLSDLPTATLSIFVLSRVPAWFTAWLRLPGGFFLIYLAWGAFRVWRSHKSLDATPPPSAGHGAIKGALVNLLNPNPWMAWTLVIGPLLSQSLERSSRPRNRLPYGFLWSSSCLAWWLRLWSSALPSGLVLA